MTGKELGNECAFTMPENAGYPTTFGLTKREYFAGLALQGLLAYPRPEEFRGDFAVMAVQNADALLDELAKEQS